MEVNKAILEGMVLEDAFNDILNDAHFPPEVLP